jgi:hypothetical protein
MAYESFTGAHTVTPSGVRRRHIRHEGVLAVPTASGTVRLIRLHDAYETEQVEALSTKFGEAPKIPAYTDVDSNRTFLSGQRETTQGMTEGMRGHTWHVSAVYEYVLTDPVGLDSEMPGGKLYVDVTLEADPATAGNTPIANIPATSFVTGLLGKPSPE